MNTSRLVPNLAKSASSQTDQEKDFTTTSQVEILFILNDILKEKSLLTLIFERDGQFILSSILAIGTQRNELVLDCGIDSLLNQLAVKCGNLIGVTTQKRIKIEFNCCNFQLIQFEGRDAFRVDLPASLKRIQRRNFYRIATPILNPATCSIPLSGKNGKESTVFPLSEISCGGMSLQIDQHPEIHFDLGAIIEHCQIDLPAFGMIETAIQVKNVYSTTLDNGLSCRRAGCEFVGLPEKSRAFIQRYISKLEQQARKFQNDDDF